MRTVSVIFSCSVGYIMFLAYSGSCGRACEHTHPSWMTFKRLDQLVFPSQAGMENIYWFISGSHPPDGGVSLKYLPTSQHIWGCTWISKQQWFASKASFNIGRALKFCLQCLHHVSVHVYTWHIDIIADTKGASVLSVQILLYVFCFEWKRSHRWHCGQTKNPHCTLSLPNSSLNTRLVVDRIVDCQFTHVYIGYQRVGALSM